MDKLHSEMNKMIPEPERAGNFNPETLVWSETAVRCAMLKAYNAALDSLKKTEHSKVIPFTGEGFIVVDNGTDNISLSTYLPPPFSPSVDPTPLKFKFYAPHGKGEEYVKKVFGITPKVIKF